ncbi:FimB/Mfa2 family fimbrial subunit [Bacteroides timonensis]|uniref:FimB/Mfa2 family fimbrial subunit n=1 Tax=Bacteroides timonensis TaxID=1470345 RepID=UPI0005C6C2EE|nr:FimB/Mfa2 family fimbrial subunit [Bacteroides timonensis]
MKTQNTHNIYLHFLLVTFILCGCEHKELSTHEELYTSSIPLTLDWQVESPTTSTVKVHIWGAHTSATQGIISTDTLFMLDAHSTAQLSLLEAKYTIVAWHDARNVSFDGTYFHLKADEKGFLPEPEAFCAGYETIQATAQEEKAFALKMHPYTRNLAFSFQLDAQAKGRIEAITATLSGIASARKLGERTLYGTSGGSIALALEREETPETRTEGTVKYSCRKRLLGIHPEERQLFVITLHYTNGEQEVIEEDLTSALFDFNANGNEEKDRILSATINFAGQSNMSATIEDWELGADTDLDANN